MALAAVAYRTNDHNSVLHSTASPMFPPGVFYSIFHGALGGRFWLLFGRLTVSGKAPFVETAIVTQYINRIGVRQLGGVVVVVVVGRCSDIRSPGVSSPVP